MSSTSTASLENLFSTRSSNESGSCFCCMARAANSAGLLYLLPPAFLFGLSLFLVLVLLLLLLFLLPLNRKNKINSHYINKNSINIELNKTYYLLFGRLSLLLLSLLNDRFVFDPPLESTRLLLLYGRRLLLDGLSVV